VPFDEVVNVQLVPEAASQARRVVRERLLSWDVAVDHDVVVLLASEAVCNAVQHGRSPASLRLTWDGITLRLEVRDAGTDSLPVPRDASGLAESGRGLALVAALAHRWGIDVGADSKALWFEVRGRRDDDLDDGVPAIADAIAFEVAGYLLLRNDEVEPV
jgi:anti-sigma regulatory factor (Ser/Thr protein kinase)